MASTRRPSPTGRSVSPRWIAGLGRLFPNQLFFRWSRKPLSSLFASTRFCRSRTACTPLQVAIPRLSRSSLHRCLERDGISRLPEVDGDKPRRKKFDLSDRLLPHRPGRNQDRRGQGLPVCGRRPNLEVCGGRTCGEG